MNVETTISVAPTKAFRQELLEEPTYGWGDTVPRKPTLREVLVEWFDSINFVKNRTRLLTALFVAFHLATFGVFIYFFIYYFSVANVALVILIASLLGTVYNTVWYHRYCSHRAYKFRSLAWTRLFLWTNPICFREESYAIPHRIHHTKGDKPGDPYGPHLGWLGSYLANESSTKTNVQISRSEYERLAKGLQHIGFPLNSYEEFQRTGSVEQPWYWMTRSVFANLLWGSLAYLIGGGFGVMAWLAGVFYYTFSVRDFNYRGHGGRFFEASHGKARNQAFFGYTGGEWHDNHHAHPRLAHSGLTWWQLDLPFLIIKAMKACGIVVQMHTLKDKIATNGSEPAADDVG